MPPRKMATRKQLEILQREHDRAVDLSFALVLEQIHCSLGAAVDRIMQPDAVEAVIAGGLGSDSYLFDGAGVMVTVRTYQGNLRRVGLAGLDEKILADANGLALLHTSDVVDAVSIHLNRSAIDIVLSARELDLLSLVLLSKVELDLAALEGAIHRDLELGLGTADGAQIAAAFLDLDRHAGPGGVMIGDANLFHRGQITDANVKVLGRHRSGSDIVLDAFRQTAEQKLIAAGETAGRHRLHCNLFPLRGTLKAGM